MNNNYNITFLFAFIVLANYVKCESENCYQRSDHPYSFFASKTVYSYVSAKQNYTQPNCEVLQLWLLSRHGTRHPSAGMINKISNLTNYKYQITENSTLCKEDIDAINKWDFNLTKQDGNKLNSQGADDLSSLGFRLKHLYKDIFNESYDTESFKVLSSPKSRCVDSAIHFLNSAFDMNITDIPLMDSDDTKLNISKFKKINDDDDTKDSEFQELKAFYNGEPIQQLLYRVSKTLGLSYNLTIDTVKIMYESCRYDKSWRINSHPAWCAVFSQEDLEILEYGEDLKYYYHQGYGDSYNEGIGCPIVKDLITNFRNATAGSRNGPRGVFYFGHSSNVLSAIVRLGFARDAAVPLSAAGFADGRARDRKWRTSRLSPFAANVMAALYRCGGEHKVTFFVNEVPMVVEQHGCTLCPWPLIDQTFDPIVSDQRCEAPGRTSSAASSTDLSKNVITRLLLFASTLIFITRSRVNSYKISVSV